MYCIKLMCVCTNNIVYSYCRFVTVKLSELIKLPSFSKSESSFIILNNYI